MGRKPRGVEPHPTETLRLRHYVMNLIYRGGHDSVMIPSSRALAEQFGVARSTVQLALEKLVEDGYLFSRQGVGTFTNPARGFVFSGDRPPPLIGVIWGDGRNFFHDHFICRQLGALGARLTETGWNIRPLTLTSASAESIGPEVTGAHLDGLVWVFPNPNHRELLVRLAATLPLVAMPLEEPWPGLACVTSDFPAAGRRLGELMRREQRHRLLFGVTGPRLSSSLNGLRRYLAEKDYPTEETWLSDAPSDFAAELERRLTALPPPEALFVNGRQAGLARELLTRHGVDPRRQCRVVALQYVLDDPGFCGLVLEEDHDAAAREAADLMRRLVAEPGRPVEHRQTPVSLAVRGGAPLEPNDIWSNQE